MADEAQLVYETGPPIPFTVGDGNGIEKGTILAISDPFTASGATAIRDPVAGIAASEKIASDGKTKLGVYREGVFIVTLSGACTAGDALMVAGGTGTNDVMRVDDVSGSAMIGYALETGATTESIYMELKPGAGGNP